MNEKIKSKDIYAIISGLLSGIEGIKNNSKKKVKSKVNQILKANDFVSREEFEEVKEIALKAREENNKLLKKIKLMENKIKKTK